MCVLFFSDVFSMFFFCVCVCRKVLQHVFPQIHSSGWAFKVANGQRPDSRPTSIAKGKCRMQLNQAEK